LKNSIYPKFIIITYNSERVICDCIDSLVRYSSVPLDSFIVIDNSPNKNTLRVLNKYYGKIKLIKNLFNTGFSSSVNQGLKLREGLDVVLVNPDVVTKSNLQEKLFLNKNFPKYDVIGINTQSNDSGWHPTSFREPNVLTGIFEFTNLKKIFPQNRYSYSFNKIDESKNYSDGVITDSQLVSGEFMYIKNKVIEKMGFFDEDFFMYMEDMDYCVRARKYGFKVGQLRVKNIYHEGGASSGNKYKIKYGYWSKSRKLFFKKHLGFLQYFPLLILFSLDDLLVYLIKYFKNEHKNY
jgi:hypothetical protein